MIELNEIDPRLPRGQMAATYVAAYGPVVSRRIFPTPIELGTASSSVLFFTALAISGLVSGTMLAGIMEKPTNTTQSLAEMTYKGMTLTDFSKEMSLPVDHPYLVSLFEQLCMSEDA